MIHYEIPLDELSAIPQSNMAELLHKTYKRKFVSSLSNLLGCAAQALDEDCDRLISYLSMMERTLPNFFSPWLYSIYYQLLESMQKDDILSVKQIISVLNQAEERAFFIQERTIQAGLLEDWEKQVFLKEVNVAFGEDKLLATPPNLNELNSFKSCVEKTLQLIAAADPVFIKEINSLLSTILLVNSPVHVGATSPKFFGAVYISLPQGHLAKHNLLFLAEHLVHETSHLFLNSIIAHDPLILNDPEERFNSPIRSDLRPLLGVYHAAFVLSRVIRVFKNVDLLDLYHDKNLIKKSIQTLIDKYETAYRTVHEHAVFTKIGKQIVETTRDCASLC